ncbi:MAG: hypothetical protein FJ388_16695, partial [Verrucomicrobia bacterium]|nr:hypothetical protein [Verrucomicrobiota bacterium]
GPVISSLAGEAGSTLLISNNVLGIMQTNDTTFAGLLTGAGALRKAGTGTLTLSGSNDYAGGTILNGGRLSVSNEVSLGLAGSALTFAGGLLRVSNDVAALPADWMTNITGHVVNWNSFNGGFDIADGANLFTVTNSISGPGSVVKFGAGTLVLAGPNAFRSNLVVNAGTVRVDNALGLAGVPVLQMTGGVLDLNAYNVSVSGLSGLGGQITDNSAVAGVTTLTLTNLSGNTMFGGRITDGAGGRQLAFSMFGTNTVLFTNDNTYTGNTILYGGTLALSNLVGAISGRLSGSTNITIYPQATLLWSDTSTAFDSDRLNSAAVRIVMRGGTFVFTNDGSGTAFSANASELNAAAGGSTIATRPAAGGSVLAFGSNLTRNVGATINFVGTGVGASTLNRVEFPAGVMTALMTNNILGGWATVNGVDWATYDFAVNSVSNYVAYQVNGSPGTWDGTVNAKLTTNMTLTAATPRTVYSLNLGMTNRGNATQTLNLNTNTLTVVSGGILFSSNAVTTISGGRLTAGTFDQPSELILNAFNAITTNFITAVITNNGTGPLTLTKNGPGWVLLSTNSGNAYSGGTIIAAGILALGGDSAGTQATNTERVVTGLGTGAVTIEPNAQLRLGGTGGALTSNSIYYLTNAITLNGGLILAQDGEQHLRGPITLGGVTNSTLQATNMAKELNVDGVLSGTGGLRVIGASSAVILVNSNNSYSGGTIVDGGFLLI